MSNFTIQHGVWINHNSAPVLGATLTVSIRWGNYLIAALSSLVAWAGTRAWAILLFVLHQRLAAKQEKDILEQQLQVHFRSGGSVFDSIIDGLGLCRAWSGRAGEVRRRTLSLVLLAAIFLLGFAAAGIFVAEVATKSYQDVLVLASPNDCGDFAFSDPAGQHDAFLNAVVGYQEDAAIRARSYARAAYNGTKPGLDVFSQPSLPLKGRTLPCPYTNGTACLGANNTHAAAWTMETGLLDSHIHFGMNAPQQDRVAFGKNVTCAVADTTNLTTAPYSRLEGPHKINITYVGILQEFAPDLGEDSNLAFEVDMNLVYERAGFFTQRAIYQAGFGDPDVAASAPPFLRDDADVVLLSITQGQMFYGQPVDDPVFLAQEPVTGDDHAAATADTVYYSSKPFALVVCTEQIQFCNPSNGHCFSLSSFLGQREQLRSNKVGFNKAQLATALRMAWVMNYVGSFSNNVAHGTNGLLVAEASGVRDGASLPPDQWTKEAQLWFESNLAAIQNGLLQWIAKPWPKGRPETAYSMVNMSRLHLNYNEHNVKKQMDTLCRNQLISSSAAVQNFSILALTLVIVMSLAIIITSIFLAACVDASRNRRTRRGRNVSRAAEAGRIARVADNKYSLLAMALQAGGVESWEQSRAGIPVTTKRVSVGPLVERNGLTAYACAACVCSSGSGTLSVDYTSVRDTKSTAVQPASASSDAGATREKGEPLVHGQNASDSSVQTARSSTDLTLVVDTDDERLHTRRLREQPPVPSGSQSLELHVTAPRAG